MSSINYLHLTKFNPHDGNNIDIITTIVITTTIDIIISFLYLFFFRNREVLVTLLFLVLFS